MSSPPGQILGEIAKKCKNGEVKIAENLQKSRAPTRAGVALGASTASRAKQESATISFVQNILVYPQIICVTHHRFTQMISVISQKNQFLQFLSTTGICPKTAKSGFVPKVLSRNFRVFW